MSTERASEDYFPSKMELKANDFEKGATLKSKKCALVLFYAPWCGFCKLIKDSWKQFASISGYMDVFAFNCEKNGDYLAKIKEDKPYLIPGFPTIVFYQDGKPSTTLNSKGRDEEENIFLQRLLSESMSLCASA